MLDPVVEIPKAVTKSLQNQKDNRNFHYRVDSESFTYYHDLDEKLINGVDKLLKRNSVDITVVKTYKIVENTGENSTSAKIAQAVVEGLKS